MNQTANITVPADVRFLEVVALFVSRMAELAGMRTDDVHRIELAVDEACTNVIKHSYAYDGSQLYSVSCTFDDRTFTIHVEDRGKPFDPEAVPEPDRRSPLENRTIGGLGLFLIRETMDEVTHSRLPDGTKRLTLKKTISNDRK